MLGYEEDDGSAQAAQLGDEDLELLFVDEAFPTDRCMLTDDAPANTTWRRPHELCDEPLMFVDGVGRFDVVQGYVGNCWSMAACAAVAEYPELIARVVPQGQILHGPGYSGRIIIRLWHMNHWRDVEIDDRLPVHDDELLYARSSSKNEFWVPLVEKAYAKFHGGYQNLVGGLLAEGFVNLTGYSVRTISLDDYKEDNRKNDIFKLLMNEYNNKSLIVCARGGTFSRGLPGFHGYTITNVRHLRSVKQRLLRLRNPWGDDEWTGKWRDDHDIWKELSADILEQLDYKVHQDGEFWMKLVDFLKMFDEICIASRKPSVHEKKYVPATEEKVQREFWNKKTAGGPLDEETFAHNPQFLLHAVAATAESEEELDNSEEYDDDSENENEIKSKNGINGNCTEEPDCDQIGVPVLIELLQDHNRRLSTDLLTIDFFVFKVREEQAKVAVQQGKPLTLPQLREGCDKHCFSHSDDENSAASAYCHLQPDAQYVAVPYTGAPGQQRRFLLRVFARNAHVHLRLLGDADADADADADDADDAAQHPDQLPEIAICGDINHQPLEEK